MTEKKKAVPGSAGAKKQGRTKPVVSETKMQPKRKIKLAEFAGDIEQVMGKAEVILAAKGITQKLQDMAENLSKLEANDIMPLMDGFRQTFGPQAGEQFSQVATAKIRELITTVQNSKTALDNEVMRLETQMNGGDASDAAMGAPPPPAPPAPNDAAEAPDLGEKPPVDGEQPSPDMMPPTDDDAIGMAGFAGRARKESAVRKGRKLTEENAADSLEIKSCLEALADFSPKCFSFAHSIMDSIENLAVSGEIRNKLIRALGHLMAMATSGGGWDDPGAMADLSIEKHLVDGPMAEVAKAGDIKRIVNNMHKLAHMLALKHEGSLAEDEAVMGLEPLPSPTPASPDSPLRAGPVFESRQRAKNIRRLRESNNPDAMILSIFRSVLRECRSVAAAVNGTAGAFGIDPADVVAIIREAKSKLVSEDAVPALMGVEMGQPDPAMNPALMGQRPTAANPQPGKPNKPMTPADMRAQKQARQAQDKAAGNQPKAPIVEPKTRLPVQQVQPRQGQQTVKPVLSPQSQQQMRANMPKMPGKVVNNTNLRTV